MISCKLISIDSFWLTQEKLFIDPRLTSASKFLFSLTIMDIVFSLYISDPEQLLLWWEEVVWLIKAVMSWVETEENETADSMHQVYSTRQIKILAPSTASLPPLCWLDNWEQGHCLIFPCHQHPAPCHVSVILSSEAYVVPTAPEQGLLVLFQSLLLLI